MSNPKYKPFQKTRLSAIAVCNDAETCTLLFGMPRLSGALEDRTHLHLTGQFPAALSAPRTLPLLCTLGLRIQ